MRFDALSNAALCPGVRRGSDYAHLSLSGAEKEDWYRVPPCTNQVPMQDVCAWPSCCACDRAAKMIRVPGRIKSRSECTEVSEWRISLRTYREHRCLYILGTSEHSV